jgi:hypothetical protein
MISCVMGTFLPYFFLLLSVEPANAGPTMQVTKFHPGVFECG